MDRSEVKKLTSLLSVRFWNIPRICNLDKDCWFPSPYFSFGAASVRKVLSRIYVSADESSLQWETFLAFMCVSLYLQGRYCINGVFWQDISLFNDTES